MKGNPLSHTVIIDSSDNLQTKAGKLIQFLSNCALTNYYEKAKSNNVQDGGHEKHCTKEK